MTDLFFKLLGVPADQIARVADSRLRFRGDVDLLWILFAALGLGVLVFLMYRKSAPDLSPVKKYTLATLRTVFLLLILVLLMRPVWAFTIESTVRRELVLMLDASTSMKVEDPRSDQDDLKRVAIAKGTLDPAGGLKQTLPPSATVEKVSRLDLVKTVFKSPKFDLLPRLAKDYNVDTFTFDSALADVPAGSMRRQGADTAATTQPANTAWLDALVPAGQQTAVGDALRAVVARKRGQPMAGIVLVTDGANNSGSDPRAAAQLAKDARVPLYIYGVGITSPKNLVVGNIFAPEISFVKDEVPVTVRVKSQGIPAAKVTLKLVDANGQETDVDHKDVSFDQDAEPAVALKFTPKTKGDYQLKAVAEPVDSAIVELSKDDNQSAQGLKVIDSKIKVLLIDQAPRWEFKYLMAQLLRDRRVDAKVVLLEGSPGLAATPDSPYLAKLPDTKEALFKYDLIILGDVDAKTFSTNQLEAIEEFVTKFGGGLAVVAGKRNNPWTYRKTPIEKMLPVELEAGAGFVNTTAGPGGEEVSDKPIKLELTAVGKRTPMLRLDPDDATSERIWAKLPPIFWVAPVARAKPAADVFLVDPSPSRSTRYGKMPVVAAQQYGMGQVMYVGTDNTWRWRKNKGDAQYVTLWGQVIQRLALPHLLGASKRTQLTFDKKEYVTNEKVNLYARLYTEAYAPITQDKVKAYVTETGPDDPRAREVILRPLPDQPGMYRGEFNAPEKPAGYKLYVDLDKTTLVDLPVSEPKMEPGENALNAELLETLARTTGGKFVREEDLYTLPDQIKAETPKVVTNLEVEFWTSPLYYGLMILILAAEWVMRKMVQLK